MILFNPLERRVCHAQTDSAAADRLIAQYKPFIAKTVKDHLGRYVPQEDSDEFAVALSAFHEAIQAYVPEKGRFLPFASQVIRLRLIDLYRKQSKELKALPLESGPDGQEQDLTIHASMRSYSEEAENLQRRYEILALTDALAPWGITFGQVASQSPKQESLRALYVKVARTIASSEHLRAQLTATRKLPILQLIEACGIDRKRLERGRVYIIACFIILDGDYPYLQDYLKWK